MIALVLTAALVTASPASTAQINAQTDPASNALTLEQAQSLLLSQAPELRAEKTGGQKARAQVSEVHAAFWPSLDAFASYQAFSETNHLHVELPPPIRTVDRDLGDKDREEYGIDLTYPLFAGGQRRGHLKARKAAVRASDESVRARQNQLSFRLVSLYYAWHGADAAQRTQTSIARALEDSWNRISTEVQQGAALKSREGSARARWLGAQLDRQAALDTRDSIGRAAALLLGLPPGQSVAFAWDSATASSAAASPGSGATRPEIESLNLTAQSLEYQERAMLGQKFPSLSALAGYRIANPGLNLGSDDYMNYGLIGLQLKWNLFDGFRNRAQRLQLHAQRDAIGVERERQAAFWSEAVLSADRYAARMEMALEAANASQEAAREGLREKTAQRKQGAASELDLTDAGIAEAKAALQVRQLTLQGMLAGWQQRFARGETLVFSQGQ